MSSFYGLEVARTGLVASQKAIDVTGHNIANANTDGYSRQRLTTAAIEPAVAGSRFAASGVSMTGGGVEVINIDQIRSTFLDEQYRQEISVRQDMQIQADGLEYLELVFDELSNNGLSDVLSDFSDSLDELTKNPDILEFRASVAQTAESLTEIFHDLHARLVSKQSDLNQSVADQTGQVNELSGRISGLNVEIDRYEMSGQPANDLLDQRNLLLDQLSEYVLFDTQKDSNGRLQVLVGGRVLVDHDQAYELSAEKTKVNPLTGQSADLYTVVWRADGQAVNLASGSLKGTLDLRDGDTSGIFGLPYVSAQLDQLVNGIASAINEVHASGWTLPDAGSGQSSQTGIDFFMTSDGSPAFTAANLVVNPDILDNYNLIAASDSEITSSSLTGNNKAALALVDLFSNDAIPVIGSFDGYLQAMVHGIATESGLAKSRLASQNLMVNHVEQSRQSVSGVSLDEEMTNLVKFQHSYSAASRVISTIDEMLDVLINRTGRVGL